MKFDSNHAIWNLHSNYKKNALIFSQSEAPIFMYIITF